MSGIRLSIRTIADYMAATPSMGRKILQRTKYPDSEEAKASINYYNSAKTAIKAFHLGKMDEDELREMASRLADQAANESLEGRARILASNARVLEAYAETMVDKKFEILSQKTYRFPTNIIQINATPDLIVNFRGRKKFIRFDFNAQGWKPEVRRVVLQGIFEAVNKEEKIKSSDCMLFHVQSGEEYKSPRLGSRIKSDIDATCENIVSIWDGITDIRRIHL